jgi:hypothetical protein
MIDMLLNTDILCVDKLIDINIFKENVRSLINDL